MASPVTPPQFKAIIPSPTSSLCGNFLNALIKLPLMVYQLVNWMLNSDGTISNAFLSLMQKPGDLIFSAAPLAPDTTRLLCDGSAVSRTTYAALYAAVGTTYGVGDNSTTFNLPDFRDRFPVGAGNLYPLAGTGGEATHVLSNTEMPSHTHALTTGRAIADGNADTPGGGLLAVLSPSSDAVVTGSPNANSGGGGAHQNLPPYLACYIYVKT